MSEACDSSCGSCSKECSSRKSDPKSFLEKPHKLSQIKKVIGVVSGKGGVGKSSVTSMLAVSMNRKGYGAAILDADITGPSIPKLFGLTEKAYGTDEGLFPVVTKTGIDVMSINLLLDKPTDPVVWRGPVIAGAVKQFWQEVVWQDVDYMFVDMPPGTGDVPLTVFQSIPLDGIVIVTSPQELVSMIVGKAVKMAKMMNVPIIGVIENYSYFMCPDCNQKHYIFGESKLEQVAKAFDVEILAALPINPEFAALCDAGKVEDVKEDIVSAASERILEFCK